MEFLIQCITKGLLSSQIHQFWQHKAQEYSRTLGNISRLQLRNALFIQDIWRDCLVFTRESRGDIHLEINLFLFPNYYFFFFWYDFRVSIVDGPTSGMSAQIALSACENILEICTSRLADHLKTPGLYRLPGNHIQTELLWVNNNK